MKSGKSRQLDVFSYTNRSPCSFAVKNVHSLLRHWLSTYHTLATVPDLIEVTVELFPGSAFQELKIRGVSHG